MGKDLVSGDYQYTDMMGSVLSSLGSADDEDDEDDDLFERYG